MIERLVDLERPYGGLEYSRLSKRIMKLRQTIEEQLDPQGLDCLERLTDAYIQQGTAILYDAFADGFFSAVELMLDFLQKRKSL